MKTLNSAQSKMLTNYICDYFMNSYPFLANDIFSGSKYLKEIFDIFKDKISEGSVALSDILFSKLDDYIDEYIYEKFKNAYFYQQYLSHIGSNSYFNYKLLSSSEKVKENNLGVFRYFRKKMWINGRFDSAVLNGDTFEQNLKRYNSEYKFNKLWNEYGKYVYEFLFAKYPNVSNLDIISKEIATDIIRENCGLKEILSGKYDNNIDVIFKKYIKEMKSLKDYQTSPFDDLQIKNYIFRYVLINKDFFDFTISDDKKIDERQYISRLCEKISYELTFKKDFSANNVLNGSFDDVINSIVSNKIMRMKNFSIKGKEGQNLIRANYERKYQKAVKIKISIGFITVIALASAITAKMINESQAIPRQSQSVNIEYTNINNIDDFDYSVINTIYTDQYIPTVNNIVISYGKFFNYGHEDLAFYRAYECVMQDRLQIMDKMISDVKNQAKNSNNLALYNDINKYNSFLDYVYDVTSLTEKEQKDFLDTVTVYNNLKNEQTDKDVTTYSLLNNSQKRKVEKLMNLYRSQMNLQLQDFDDELAYNESEAYVRHDRR